MSKDELASLLNGRAYSCEITIAEAVQAKADGLVVVFGYSDDSVEFRGAIEDEVSALEGVTALLTRDGILEACNDDCASYRRAKAKATPLAAVWRDVNDSPCWTFETEIPHATFDIVEDGEPFCRGIVFALSDVPV